MSAIQQIVSSIGGVAGPTYATWDPAAKGSTITLSSGNTVATGNFSSIDTSVHATVSKSSGKWYWECTIGGGSSPFLVGIGKPTANLALGVGQTSDSWGYYSANGVVYNNNTLWVSLSSTYGNGNVIGFILDATNNSVDVWLDTNFMGTISGMTGPYTPIFGGGFPNANSVCTLNCGASAFVYPSRPTSAGANPGLY